MASGVSVAADIAALAHRVSATARAILNPTEHHTKDVAGVGVDRLSA
jgi:hypothetical protein